MHNLVRLSQAEKAGVPIKKSTLYYWVHIGKHPELFVKIGGAQFLDLDRWGAMVEAGRGQKTAHPGRPRK